MEDAGTRKSQPDKGQIRCDCFAPPIWRLRRESELFAKPRLTTLPSIFLLGLPASGKCTVANGLKAARDYSYINVGQALRDRFLLQRDYREELKTNISADLAPRESVFGLLKKNISKLKSRGRPYLIHGFPQSVDELIRFEREVGDCMGAVYLDIPISETYRRTAVRRFKGSRRDDTKEIVQKRNDIFEDKTPALIEHLDSKGKLLQLDGRNEPKVLVYYALWFLDQRWPKKH